MYKSKVLAVFTRRATANAKLKELQSVHWDAPDLEKYGEHLDLYMADLAAYEAEWKCLKKPIGPPLPSNAKKPEDPQEPAAPHLDCDHCIHTSASGVPWCTRRFITTPVVECQHFERSE